MKSIAEVFVISRDFRVTLFSFTGMDPGSHGVCADVVN
jgi:hypothetical protein